MPSLHRSKALSRFFALALLLAPATRAASVVIDKFNYPDQKSAITAWRAIGQTPPVSTATGAERGLAFPCPFSSDIDRVYWDRAVSLDLSGFTSFELDIDCAKPEALRSLALYFKSGDGWFVWNKPLRMSGRQRLILLKEQFSSEGRPVGWRKIERVRLSPWKGSPLDTSLTAFSLTAQKDSMAVVKATLSTPDPGERNMSARTAQRVSRWLNDLGISHTLISEDQVVAGALGSVRLAILPYNPDPPPSMIKALRRFAANGGRLIVCYSASEDLAHLMDVQLGAYIQGKDPGRWRAMVFGDAESLHVPDCVFQTSWNIRPVSPLPGKGRVIAYWENAAGEMSSDPAWVETGRGLWMTHILLEDDSRNKAQMMLGLVGRLDPSVWPLAARRSIEEAGKIDNFGGLGQAIAGITALARGQSSEDAVQQRLARAKELFNGMQADYDQGNFISVVESARSLQQCLTESYGMAQQPKPGEFRGVWDHNGTGWFPGDWDRTCKILADSGMTAIFANELWAGLAHYPSKVVPTSDTLRLYGDQVAACTKAARKYGLQVHIWKVCWNVEQAPDDFVARMKKEGRLLKSQDGKVLPWLDPAIPENADLELAAIKELVSKYDFDGLHLDYIRYPPGADKRRKKPEAITQFVKRVHDAIKSIRPGVKLSAAVWGNYPDVIDSVGQDWASWLKAGYVDFVCPMNYTADRYQFSSLLQRQLVLPGSRGRVYPGIGVSAAESQLRPDEVIEQILMLRRAGAAGFMLFDLSHPLLDETLPALRRGITAVSE